MPSAELVRATGIGLFIVGVLLFVIPYFMDVMNQVRGHAPAAVAYFWGSRTSCGLTTVDCGLWAACGMVILGLVLIGASFTLKTKPK